MEPDCILAAELPAQSSFRHGSPGLRTSAGNPQLHRMTVVSACWFARSGVFDGFVTGGLAGGLTPGGFGLSSSISTCGPTALGSPNPSVWFFV